MQPRYSLPRSGPITAPHKIPIAFRCFGPTMPVISLEGPTWLGRKGEPLGLRYGRPKNLGEVRAVREPEPGGVVERLRGRVAPEREGSRYVR